MSNPRVFLGGPEPPSPEIRISLRGLSSSASRKDILCCILFYFNFIFILFHFCLIHLHFIFLLIFILPYFYLHFVFSYLHLIPSSVYFCIPVSYFTFHFLPLSLSLFLIHHLQCLFLFYFTFTPSFTFILYSSCILILTLFSFHVYFILFHFIVIPFISFPIPHSVLYLIPIVI